MAGSKLYDLMYRYWAPWDSVGVRQDLVALLDSGRIDPHRFPRAIDMGCGTGANVVYMAQQGFDAYGLDFSPVALEKAAARAEEAGVADRCRWVLGDLTAEQISGLDEPFDLLIDFGTLDDLRETKRAAMARLVSTLARPGAVFLEWCFYGERDSLPWFAMGPSKLTHIAPGELESLFGDSFDVEPFSLDPVRGFAAFLLTKKERISI